MIALRGFGLIVKKIKKNYSIRHSHTRHPLKSHFPHQNISKIKFTVENLFSRNSFIFLWKGICSHWSCYEIRIQFVFLFFFCNAKANNVKLFNGKWLLIGDSMISADSHNQIDHGWFSVWSVFNKIIWNNFSYIFHRFSQQRNQKYEKFNGIYLKTIRIYSI